ncbi:hypothetical protein [Citrobacter werkmanii]|uniref:hypothetical protein n=1 Tax=Citrobacter werkmanii TaxID=67827 RepID=UPI00254BE8AF|nr:hypothetical protein [Citrobacter werkmanii]
MTALNKQALTDEAISHAFTGTNFGRDDLRNILAETVIDAAAGWRCGHTATTICTQLGLLTPKGSASALGLRFISEHVQRETKRLKDGLEAAEKRIAELEGMVFSVKLPVAPLQYETLKLCLEPSDGYGMQKGAEYMRDEIIKVLHAAGIGVKGE